jgi:hypothetical protein
LNGNKSVVVTERGGPEVLHLESPKSQRAGGGQYRFDSAGINLKGDCHFCETGNA